MGSVVLRHHQSESLGTKEAGGGMAGGSSGTLTEAEKKDLMKESGMSEKEIDKLLGQ